MPVQGCTFFFYFAQWCHVDSGCASSGITIVSGGDGVDSGSGFGVGIVIGSDRVVAIFGCHIQLFYELIL